MDSVDPELLRLLFISPSAAGASGGTIAGGDLHDACSTALRAARDDEQSQPAQVSLAYLDQCTEKFSAERRLGEGTFGLVYEGVDPSNGLVFAVKHLVRGDAMLRSAQREIQVLSRFRHPHIVRLLGYTPPESEGDPPCIVYELAKKGALDKALRDDTVAGELTWRVRVRIALGLAKALNYLHCGGSGEKCFHRDVKAANVCLTADLSAKLIDCGLAMYVPDSGASHAGRTMLTASGGALGTPGYMCPRYVSSGKFGCESEVYSFGVVLLELITGRVQNTPEDLFLIYIEDEERDLADDADTRAGEWPRAVSTALASLAKSCLAKFQKRLHSVAPALQQLAALSREHCRPTAEEVQLGALREEVEQLRRAAQLDEASRDARTAAEAAAEAAALAAAEADRQTCVVCYEAFNPAFGASCSEGHFMCGAIHGDDCLGGHVGARAERLRGVDGLAALEREALLAGNTRRALELGGSVFCPVPGCTAPALSDVVIARYAGELVVSDHLRSKALLPIVREVLKVFEQAQTALQAAQAELEGRVRKGEAREAAQRLLAQQLQTEFPNARQCRRCAFGPVVHKACWDLGAHQDEGGVDNRCPRCKWFSRDINHWPKWNGELPAEVEEPREDGTVPDLSAALNMPPPEPRGVSRRREDVGEGSGRSGPSRTAAGLAAEERRVLGARTTVGDMSDDAAVVRQVIELSAAEAESLEAEREVIELSAAQAESLEAEHVRRALEISVIAAHQGAAGVRLEGVSAPAPAPAPAAPAAAVNDAIEQQAVVVGGGGGAGGSAGAEVDAAGEGEMASNATEEDDRQPAAQSAIPAQPPQPQPAAQPARPARRVCPGCNNTLCKSIAGGAAGSAGAGGYIIRSSKCPQHGQPDDANDRFLGEMKSMWANARRRGRGD